MPGNSRKNANALQVASSNALRKFLVKSAHFRMYSETMTKRILPIQLGESRNPMPSAESPNSGVASLLRFPTVSIQRFAAL